jgi:hypothetical protein
MAYRPNKTTGNFFSVIIIILGAVIVKKTNPHNLSKTVWNISHLAIWGLA